MRSPIELLVSLIKVKGLEYFNRFYGVYYGFVLDNEDPKGMNRLLVYVPEVNGPGERGIWAMPMGVFGGLNYGSQILPQKKDVVFIQYRFGNPEFPLWTQGNYAKDEKPEEFDTPLKYGFKTPNGILIHIDDTEDEGIITIKHPSNHQVIISEDQITIKYNDTERLVIKEDEIVLDNGNNGGLIKIRELVEKLNSFIDTFNNHVHIVPNGTSDMTQTKGQTINKSEIENTKVNH